MSFDVTDLFKNSENDVKLLKHLRGKKYLFDVSFACEEFFWVFLKEVEVKLKRFYSFLRVVEGFLRDLLKIKIHIL